MNSSVNQRFSPPSGPGSSSQALLRAILRIAAQLDVKAVLTALASHAAGLTGAAAAAVNVLDARGLSEDFIRCGSSQPAQNAIAGLENAPGVVGLMRADEALLINDLAHRPAFPGFGVTHPDVESLLGVPVRVRGMVFAHLYLINKPGGFDTPDATTVITLASAVSTAIDNAQLYEAAVRRERWLSVGQEITTAMLSGAEEEDALALIAARARSVAEADTCVLVLPSLDDRLVIEIADGVSAEDLVGTVMPRDGRSQTVLDEGIGMVVDSFSQAFTVRVDQLRQFDSALYAPMRAAGRGIGVMMLLRTAGGASFDSDDLAMAEAFAAQAAIVLVLSEARLADDVKTLLTERERIARDLHDLAIQQLFATGMRLDNARREVAAGVDPARLDDVLSVSLDNVDDSVRQIRSIIHNLRDPDADVSLTERLRREASLARAGLGFAPSMIILVDGQVVDGSELDPEYDLDRLIVQDLADDVVAVAREGLANAARHAKASSVQVTVSVSHEERASQAAGRGFITVAVADDGIGLTVESGRRSGLKNLSARARRHKGKLAVNSPSTSPGTTIVWTVPLG